MDVILKKNIAQMVAGYLEDECCSEVYYKFCKNSPHLQENYRLLKKGFIPANTTVNLECLVKEYYEIKSAINKFIGTVAVPSKFQSDVKIKLDYIISLAKSTSIPNAQSPSKANPRGAKKRKRRTSASSNTSNETDSSYRILHKKRRSNLVDFTILDDNEIEHSETDIQTRSPDDEQHHSTSEDLPTKSPIGNAMILTETILENREFQNKLVENINKILKSVSPSKFGDAKNVTIVDQLPETYPDADEENMDSILQAQMDEAIKNILDTTTREPTFEQIVDDVVYSRTSLSGDIFSSYPKEKSMSSVVSSSTPKVVTTRSHLSHPVTNITQGGNPIEICGDNRTLIIPDRNINPGEITMIESNVTHNVQLYSNENPTDKQIHILANEQVHIESWKPEDFITFNNEILPTSQQSSQLPQVPFNKLPNIIFLPPQQNQNFRSAQFPNISTASTHVTIPFWFTSSDKLSPRHPVLLNTSSSGQSNAIQSNSDLHTPVTTTTSLLKTTAKTKTTRKKKINVAPKELTAPVPTTFTTVLPANGERNEIEIKVLLDEENEPEFQNEEIGEKHNVNTSSINNIPSISPRQIMNPPPLPTVPFEVADKPPLPPLPPIDQTVIDVAESPAKDEIIVEKSTTPLQNTAHTYFTRVKSNSTPRRRSHIRVLDFNTPGKSFRRNHTSKTPKTVEKSFHLNASKVSDAIEVPAESTDIIDAKTANDNDTKKPVTNTSKKIATDKLVDTPKVKKSARKVRKNLSRSTSEETHDKSKDQKTTEEENVSHLEQWHHLRSIESKHWDQYLRATMADKPKPKPKVRIRKSPKGAEGKKKEATCASTSIAEVKMTPKKRMQNRGKIVISPSKRLLEKRRMARKSKLAEEKVAENKVAEEKEEEPEVPEEKLIDEEANTIHISSELAAPPEPTIPPEPTEPTIPPEPTILDAMELIPQEIEVEVIEEKEIVIDPIAFTMASLLETPFKSDKSITQPGFAQPLPVEDTPITKMLKSLTKTKRFDSDIKTPSFAITPGANATPPKESMTPPGSDGLFNRPTDYSSSSSYYRPDESGDVSDKIDVLLNAARKCRTDSENEAIKNTKENLSTELVDQTEIPKNAIETVVGVEVENYYDELSLVSSSFSSSSPSDSSSSSSSSSSSKSFNSSSSSDANAKASDEENEDTKVEPNIAKCPSRASKTPKKLNEFVYSNQREIEMKQLEEKRLRVQGKLMQSEQSNTQKKLTSTINKTRQTLIRAMPIRRKKPSISNMPGSTAATKPKTPRKNPTPQKLIKSSCGNMKRGVPVAKEPPVKNPSRVDVDNLLLVLGEQEDGETYKKSVDNATKTTTKVNKTPDCNIAKETTKPNARKANIQKSSIPTRAKSKRIQARSSSRLDNEIDQKKVENTKPEMKDNENSSESQSINLRLQSTEVAVDEEPSGKISPPPSHSTEIVGGIEKQNESTRRSLTPLAKSTDKVETACELQTDMSRLTPELPENLSEKSISNLSPPLQTSTQITERVENCSEHPSSSFTPPPKSPACLIVPSDTVEIEIELENSENCQIDVEPAGAEEKSIEEEFQKVYEENQNDESDESDDFEDDNYELHSCDTTISMVYDDRLAIAANSGKIASFDVSKNVMKIHLDETDIVLLKVQDMATTLYESKPTKKSDIRSESKNHSKSDNKSDRKSDSKSDSKTESKKSSSHRSHCDPTNDSHSHKSKSSLSTSRSPSRKESNSSHKSKSYQKGSPRRNSDKTRPLKQSENDRTGGHLIEKRREKESTKTDERINEPSMVNIPSINISHNNRNSNYIASKTKKEKERILS